MDKLRLTTYLACAIEHNTEDPEAHTWKVRIKEALERPDVGVYDPIEQEEAKTGKPFKEACEYINKLKRGGVWEIFHEVMRRIWWGITKPAVGNKIRMLLMFKDRACIDGNSKIDFPVWGDYEAVARSNFIEECKTLTVNQIGDCGNMYGLNLMKNIKLLV